MYTCNKEEVAKTCTVNPCQNVPLEAQKIHFILKNDSTKGANCFFSNMFYYFLCSISHVLTVVYLIYLHC